MLPNAVAAPTHEARSAIVASSYLDRGTPGLKDFVRMGKIGGAENVASIIERFPRYYASLSTLDQEIAAETPRIRAAYGRLKALYGDAYFPDVYFIIGHLRSCGSVSERGLLIGADCYGVRGQAPTDEFTPANRKFIHPFAELPNTVMHELVHFQQSRRGKVSLLQSTLIEGGADFIAELVMPNPDPPANREWGMAHRAQIWARFAREMHGNDTSDWIGNNDRETADWPAALSYFVGYEIAKAYYEKSADKKAAIRELLELADADAIVAKSGYAEQFK